MVPEDRLNFTGSYQFNSTTNPQLVLTLDSAENINHPAQLWTIEDASELFMCVFEWNTHQQVRGDLMANFM